MEGTWIVGPEDKMESSVVSAVAHDPNTIVIKIRKIPKNRGFISTLFNKLGGESISVDIISQTETTGGADSLLLYSSGKFKADIGYFKSSKNGKTNFCYQKCG